MVGTVPCLLGASNDFDFKCNETGISCHQKEPKNFGPSLFGPKPIDPSSPKVQLFQT